MKKLEQLVRKNILKLKPYTSARDKFQDGIFLDANENAFGSTVESFVNGLNRYPDPHQKELRKALSGLINIPAEKLFFGVGSDEIVDLSIRIFCEPAKSNVIIPSPTYGMYQVACEINDIKVKSVPLDNHFDIDVKQVIQAVDKNTRMIFLCSPNNPTGNLLNRDKIISLTKNFEGIIFLDEAYIDFAEDKSFLNYLSEFNNVIISRTFSKAWGLAGVRCGYCIADEFIINLLFKVKAPYTINKLTSAIVLEAISQLKKRDEIVEKTLWQKENLMYNLSHLKCVEKIYPSDANFILVKVKNAKSVFDYLNKNKIRVRMRTDDERLKDSLRITVGNSNENNLLIKLLKEFE